MDLLTASMTEISNGVKQKKVSAREVAGFFSERVSNFNPKLNAYTSTNEKLLEQASAIDSRIQKGEDPGPLAGVPFGIKEMFCVKGMKATAASKILANFSPPYHATVVDKLEKAGVTFLGKLNQDEFAMGSSSETSYFGVTKNPWNTECVPGGSSGGSAAAQASRLAVGTLGTDTGGSIRQPAHFCGIVGVKPTYGRVSRYGIIAYASSLDQAGPMVSSVADAALTLEVICGRDERDSTTSEKPVPKFSSALSQSMKGVKIGLLREATQNGGLDPDTEATVNQAKQNLQKEGAEIVEISVPLIAQAVPMYYLIAASEASSNLARYDGVKYGHRAKFANLGAVDLEEFYKRTRGEGFGKEVKRRIMLGTYCLSSGYFDAYYNKACQVRRLLTEQYLAAFKKCDVVLSPVATHPAFRIGERIDDPLSMYLNDIFTVSTNLAGLPGMSVPYGFSAKGLPIGVQLTAAHFNEQTMLNVGLALEKSFSEKGRKPNVY